MAFNFYGVCSVQQFNALKAFVEIQKTDLEARKAYLESQQSRVGTYITTYDEATGDPISFVPLPKSYAEKLIQAYKILGGIPEQDFMLRDKNNIVFLNRGTPIMETETDVVDGTSETYSNNRRDRGRIRFDYQVGQSMNRIKEGFLESIKRKWEQLEFKIKRCLDYSDQLGKEIELIDKLLDDTNDRSLSNMIASMESYIESDDN